MSDVKHVSKIIFFYRGNDDVILQLRKRSSKVSGAYLVSFFEASSLIVLDQKDYQDGGFYFETRD